MRHAARMTVAPAVSGAIVSDAVAPIGTTSGSYVTAVVMMMMMLMGPPTDCRCHSAPR